jgi:hypothetical protein
MSLAARYTPSSDMAAGFTHTGLVLWRRVASSRDQCDRAGRFVRSGDRCFDSARGSARRRSLDVLNVVGGVPNGEVEDACDALLLRAIQARRASVLVAECVDREAPDASGHDYEHGKERPAIHRSECDSPVRRSHLDTFAKLAYLAPIAPGWREPPVRVVCPPPSVDTRLTVKGKWGDLPESDPIFEGTHFVFFAGPMQSTEELAASLRVTPAEEDDVEFVSPSVPGRRARMISTPAEESEGA